MSTETPDVTEQCCPCSTVRVTTNNVPRDIVDAYELTAAEREDFDYLDWAAIDEGADSASFIRFKGQLYDLGEFSADYGISKGTGLTGTGTCQSTRSPRW